MSKEKHIILGYLEKVNRPYSANDILQNLHKECGKSVVQKALDYLVDEKKVQEKTYGKQKVYSIVQQMQESKNVELETLEKEINSFSEETKNLEIELKTVESKLSLIQSALTTEDALKRKNELEANISTMKSKLSVLSENKVMISEADRDKIKRNHENSIKEYKKRKRICMGMVNSILEGYPKTKAALVEEVGIELDDENNTPVIP